MILTIWASPNRDGLTATAAAQVTEGIEAAGKEALQVCLNRQKIERCLICGDGWGLCRTKGQCVLRDDFASIYSQCAAAEGIVLVTPVYWHDMSESLKAFIDRLRRVETGGGSAPRLRGQRCLLIACAGGSGRGAVQCLHQMEEAAVHMGMAAVDRLPVTQFSRDYMLPAIRQAGEKFAAALGTGSQSDRYQNQNQEIEARADDKI